MKQTNANASSKYIRRSGFGAINSTFDSTENNINRDPVINTRAYKQSFNIRPNTVLDRLASISKEDKYGRSSTGGTRSFYSTIKNYGRYSPKNSTTYGAKRKYRSSQDGDQNTLYNQRFTRSTVRY